MRRSRACLLAAAGLTAALLSAPGVARTQAGAHSQQIRDRAQVLT